VRAAAKSVVGSQIPLEGSVVLRGGNHEAVMSFYHNLDNGRTGKVKPKRVVHGKYVHDVETGELSMLTRSTTSAGVFRSPTKVDVSMLATGRFWMTFIAAAVTAVTLFRTVKQVSKQEKVSGGRRRDFWSFSHLCVCASTVVSALLIRLDFIVYLASLVAGWWSMQTCLDEVEMKRTEALQKQKIRTKLFELNKRRLQDAIVSDSSGGSMIARRNDSVSLMSLDDVESSASEEEQQRLISQYESFLVKSKASKAMASLKELSDSGVNPHAINSN